MGNDECKARRDVRGTCRTVAVLMVFTFCCVLPGAAQAGRSHVGYSLTPSTTEPYAVCSPAAVGRMGCLSIIHPKPVKTSHGYKLGSSGPLLEGDGKGGGWDPKDLQEAYKIPATGGSTQTVAVVDAYHDPNAEADMNAYRKEYGLPECKKVTKCFQQVNQKGEEGNYPSSKYPHKEAGNFFVEDWGLEISLDLDMVSAACPECKVLLVEATNNESSSLGLADDEAATLKATEISDSFGGPESSTETSEDAYYNHAGIPVTVAAGDAGYGAEYPASSKYVISVGGTTLKKAPGTERGWEDTVWSGSGSGCSAYESKPSWQVDPGCSKRTENDVAAVASNSSPLSVYDSYEYTEKVGTEEFGTGTLGWILVSGTSASAPLVAGIEGHASSTVRTQGAEAFYRHKLFDVSSGADGFCAHSYLCEAEPGYDGPSGWGVPDGPLESTPSFSAVTSSATGITATTATLHGYVYAGASSAYHFEYGPTTSYGTSVPVPSGSLGAGSNWQGVSQSIGGLHTLKGTYHYRLVATAGSETVYGEDRTFTTVPWVLQSAAVPAGETTSSGLSSVSCTSSSACIAVGLESPSGSIAERWNGTEWTLQAPPIPTGGKSMVLKGVSCPSSTSCVAVGSYLNSSGFQMQLAEHWNGSEWSIQLSTGPSETSSSRLSGVSCASTTQCVAVGTGSKGVFAEGWNGSEWSLQTAVSPAGAALEAVSCSSSSACTAVGTKVGGSLVERWNGTEWALQTNPSEGRLKAVSCPSASVCMAVGDTPTAPLAERWNGSEWSIQTTPSLLGHLRGVSCASTSECIATGNAEREPLAERWNGTEWSLDPMAPPVEPIGFELVELRSVSCLSTSACIAVGSHIGHASGISSYEAPLAESRPIVKPYAETKAATNGSETGATLKGTIDPEGSETKYHFEYGTTITYGSKTAEVSAGSGTANLEESSAITGLTAGTTYHYRIVASSSGGTTDGADQVFIPGWSVISTPAPGEFSELRGVSCPSSSECIAIGSDGPPLAERWNGSEWATQSMPTSPEGTELESISCASSSACIAVGSGGSTRVPVALRWNGVEWQLQSIPHPTASFSKLKSVSCTSSSACVAVGVYGYPETLFAERWNGTEWSLQTLSSPPGGSNSTLDEVSCFSSTACTAVGRYENSSHFYGNLVERWNGTEWSQQEAPAPTGALESEMLGVSCASATTAPPSGSTRSNLVRHTTT